VKKSIFVRGKNDYVLYHSSGDAFNFGFI